MFLYYTKRALHMLQTSGPIFAARAAKYTLLKKLGRLQLMSIFIGPSHQCNANCVHCYEKFPGLSDKGLSTEEVKDIIDQFHALGPLAAPIDNKLSMFVTC